MKTENPYSAPQSNDLIPLAQQVGDEPVIDSPSSLRLLATATGIMAGIAGIMLVLYLLIGAIAWIIPR